MTSGRSVSVGGPQAQVLLVHGAPQPQQQQQQVGGNRPRFATQVVPGGGVTLDLGPEAQWQGQEEAPAGLGVPSGRTTRATDHSALNAAYDILLAEARRASGADVGAEPSDPDLHPDSPPHGRATRATAGGGYGSDEEPTLGARRTAGQQGPVPFPGQPWRQPRVSGPQGSHAGLMGGRRSAAEREAGLDSGDEQVLARTARRSADPRQYAVHQVQRPSNIPGTRT